MAAADLVVRMLIDAGAFNRNIKTAQSQMQKFTNAGKSVMAGIGKVAGALGIATTAWEVFKTAINSSVNGTAAFETAVDAAKTSVNQFFYSLTSGNFNSFLVGLDDIVRKAKATKDALLELSFSQLGFDYVKSENKAKADTYKQQAQDPRLTKEQRMDAMQKYNEVVEKHAADLQAHTEKAMNWIRQAATKNTPFSPEDVNEEMINNFLEKLLYEGREYMLATAKTANQQYRNSVEVLLPSDISREQWNDFWYGINTFLKGSMGMMGGKVGEWYNSTKVGQKDAELTSHVTNWFYDVFRANPSDEVIKKVNKILAEYAESYMTESMLNFDHQILKDVVATLAQIRAERSELASMKQGSTELANMQFGQTTKPTSTSTSQKQETIFSTDSVAGLRAQIAEAKKVRDAIDAVRDPWGFVAANMEVEQLEARLASILKMIETPDNKIEIPDFEAMGNDLEFDLKPIIEDTTDWTEQLHNVASILGSISNMTNEGAAAWLTWGANALSSIAAMIPAVEALFAVNAKNATAEAASSAAKTPVVGWITAIAAIAAMGAAFANMPKFANGGIVGSPFGSGDRVLARVNGGEMILNKHQQSNLFSLLDNGSSTGNSNVRFRIEGKDLVGVLTNYNNRINKLR